MPQKEFIVAIELGSAKITGIAGKKNADGSLNVLAVAEEDSSSCIRKGMVYNLDKTSQSITNILKKLRQALKSEIAMVYVGASGQSIHCVKNVVVRDLPDDTIITQDIINDIMDSNRAMVYPEQEILDAITQEYKVGAQLQADPIGIQAKRLEGNFLNILQNKSYYRNLNKCFDKAGIEIAEMYLAPMVMAESVLTESELRGGCVLIDLGAETNFSIWYYCAEPKGILDVCPKQLATNMTRGQSKIIDVKLSNNGTAATGEITIDLPETAWMSVVGNDTLPSLAVNDSAYFSLRLSPDNNTPLIPFEGNIAINSEHGEFASLPFNITAVSESTGALTVDVTDEFTYYGNGQHLANAEVTLKGYYSLETVGHGYTDANGMFSMEDLPEGYYRVNVKADRHSEFNEIILIKAGTTNQRDIFLQYQAVTYSWEVIPTEIGDEYTIILDGTFETNVPAPVVIIEAPHQIPDFEDSYSFNYVVTNHGLIDAYGMVLHVPEDDEFLFTPGRKADMLRRWRWRRRLFHYQQLPCHYTYELRLRASCSGIRATSGHDSRSL